MARQITESEVIALAAAVAGSGGGSGEGDMKKSTYDPDSEVKDAGGIVAYVTSKLTPDNNGYINI